MPRDYKHRRRPGKNASRRQTAFLTGLALGLAVAVLVHLYHSRSSVTPDDDARAAIPDDAQTDASAETGPVFDFYEILPDFEIVIPPAADSGETPDVPVREVPPGKYFLQAGSFRQFEDADRRKANLALLGIGSEIRKVTVNDRPHYRVQIGPISDPGELRSMQQRLGTADIEYLALRAKEEGQ